MPDKARSRVAIIVPWNRTWRWHHEIISIIRQDFVVDVYASARAPRYPLILRLWISLENFILGEFDVLKCSTISAPSWSQAEGAQYALVVNCSEVSLASSDVRIIEPRFEGDADSLNLLAILFARKNPYISIHVAGHNQPLVASYLAIEDRIVLSRGLKVSFARLVMLIDRALGHLTRDTRAAILPIPANALPANRYVRMWLFFGRFFWDKSFGRLIRRFQFPEHWSVALLQLDQWEISDGIKQKGMFLLPDDGKRYYADPFLIAHNGRRWLFVEEYDYRAGKGIISCAAVCENKMDLPSPALVCTYHLSYPFVFRHQEEIYMVPETGANRCVELYRARVFPFDWVLAKVLLDKVDVYDATLLWYKDNWWMFCAVAHEGGSAQDELAIFYSRSLEGPWLSHQLNPVKSDCRSARPAGRVITCDGRLVRPAQDCETTYGSALVWLEIEELTPERFSEREIARWSGPAMKADGIHTFNRDIDVGVMDIKRNLWKRPLGGK
jgi:hypothetical protein